jgi:hypothetical protein
MASSWTLFSSDKEKSDMLVSLKEFPEESVQAFLALVNSTATSSNTNVELPGDVVVDCCRIAHYLQNDTILATMTNVLLQSIDTANCLSICQLADSLSLCELFESAVQYLIKSLGMNSKNEDGVNDGEETWDCLTSELQERILAIKAALQSSVHANNTNHRLYFSSLTEYISIFAETVQYYRERLAAAKEDHMSMVPGTNAWIDTDRKIRRQECRVQTLETVWAEQKRLFAGKSLAQRR